jgi:methyl-accepting chemotaxis protein
MNQITQQVAANAEESASASQEMSGQSAELENLVGSFKLTNARTGKELKASSSHPVAISVAAKKPMPLSKRSPKGALPHAAATDPKQLIPFQDDDASVLKDF